MMLGGDRHIGGHAIYNGGDLGGGFSGPLCRLFRYIGADLCNNRY
jgi:hypothetical protein